MSGVLVAFASGYGYHRDELYFIAAGQHLDWAYADQGPVTPLIARAMTEISAESLTVLRLPSALAAGLTVFLTGLLARELGGTTARGADRRGLRGRRRDRAVHGPSAEHVDLRPAGLDGGHVARRARAAHGRRPAMARRPGSCSASGCSTSHCRRSWRSGCWRASRSPGRGGSCATRTSGAGRRSHSSCGCRGSCGRPIATGRRSTSRARSRRAGRRAPSRGGRSCRSSFC